jgi:4-hydroxybenzoate polyprenyltransferase
MCQALRYELSPNRPLRTTMTTHPPTRVRSSTSAATRAAALLRACHPEPTVAVTTLAALLAIADGIEGGRLAVVVLAVFTGQLVIGWSNDLLDASRDRAVGRTDKPLATGMLPQRTVVAAVAAALLACVLLSLWMGRAAGLVHLGCLVGSGIAYNAGLKATLLSWLPYAVAFGSLPTVVSLAAPDTQPAPLWMMGAGALLGIGAHLVNALPDLDDDAATGVHGLPHRLGARRTQATATVTLVAASVIAVLAPADPTAWWAWACLLLVLALAMLGLRGRGKTPFRAAVLIAVIDVVVLVIR